MAWNEQALEQGVGSPRLRPGSPASPSPVQVRVWEEKGQFGLSLQNHVKTCLNLQLLYPAAPGGGAQEPCEPRPSPPRPTLPDGGHTALGSWPWVPQDSGDRALEPQLSAPLGCFSPLQPQTPGLRVSGQFSRRAAQRLPPEGKAAPSPSCQLSRDKAEGPKGRDRGRAGRHTQEPLPRWHVTDLFPCRAMAVSGESSPVSLETGG